MRQMKNDKETEDKLAAREKEATSDETLSDVRDSEKSSGATTDKADDAQATPDGQFDGGSPSRREVDPM